MSSSSSSSSSSSDEDTAPREPSAAAASTEAATSPRAEAHGTAYAPGLPRSRFAVPALLWTCLEEPSDARKAFDESKDALRRMCRSQRDGTVTTKRDPRVVLYCEYDAKGGMAPWGQVRAPPRPALRTGPLSLIFDFYARLQEPGAQLGKDRTYAMIQDCNTRLSFFEIMCFARDFDVVPKLMTKAALAYVWRVASALPNRSAENQGDGMGAQREAGLDITEFLMLLVRIALVAFAERSVGDPERAVRCLVEWLRLDEPKRVRQIVHTRGRQTQRRINFRSKGEVDRTAAARSLREKRDEMLLRLKATKSTRAAVEFTQSQVERKEDFNFKVDDLTRVNHLLAASQQVLLASFRKDAARVLDPYVKSAPPRHWCPFDDCGIDCGVLSPHIAYAAQICVSNGSDETLVVCGLETSGQARAVLSARFDPRPFAPGMTRRVELCVKPGAGAGEFAGAVELRIGRDRAPARSASLPVGDTYLAVPVFYRVGGPGRAPRRRPPSAGAIRTTRKVRQSFKAITLNLPDRVANAERPRKGATDSQSSRSASPDVSSSSSDDEPAGPWGL